MLRVGLIRLRQVEAGPVLSELSDSTFLGASRGQRLKLVGCRMVSMSRSAGKWLRGLRFEVVDGVEIEACSHLVGRWTGPGAIFVTAQWRGAAQLLRRGICTAGGCGCSAVLLRRFTFESRRHIEKEVEVIRCAGHAIGGGAACSVLLR